MQRKKRIRVSVVLRNAKTTESEQTKAVKYLIYKKNELVLKLELLWSEANE